LEHSRSERRGKGRFVSLTSKINDDDAERSISVRPNAAALGSPDDKQPPMDPVILPTCLWHSWAS
jgi:hypothetical protein